MKKLITIESLIKIYDNIHREHGEVTLLNLIDSLMWELKKAKKALTFKNFLID